MDKHTKADYDMYVNGHNPALSTDEIEVIHSFFRIFENEHKRASLDSMTQSIATMEEFNTEIVRRVLVWMSKHSNSPCKFNSRRLSHFYETDNAAADAAGHEIEPQALLRAHQRGRLSRTDSECRTTSSRTSVSSCR